MTAVGEDGFISCLPNFRTHSLFSLFTYVDAIRRIFFNVFGQIISLPSGGSVPIFIGHWLNGGIVGMCMCLFPNFQCSVHLWGGVLLSLIAHQLYHF